MLTLADFMVYRISKHFHGNMHIVINKEYNRLNALIYNNYNNVYAKTDRIWSRIQIQIGMLFFLNAHPEPVPQICVQHCQGRT